jgi:hypothetical protein
MISDNDPITAFEKLVPVRFPVLQRIDLTQSLIGRSAEITIRLVLGQEDDDGILHLAFEGVRGLKIDWPSWSVIKLDVIQISDLTHRGMEDLRYRVSEGAGMFAFSCRAFTAKSD